MHVYAAIPIRHGRSVQLRRGDPAEVAVAGESPEAQARGWRERGARRAHVVDVDAALGEPHQWHHVERIVRTGMAVQFGGGVRSMTQIQQLLDMGVERVVVGTQGADHPYWARELGAVFPDRVVQAVDARGRRVAVEGWTRDSGKDAVEFARSLDDAGLGGVLYTDIAREGTTAGVDTDLVAELRDALQDTRLIVAGGIDGPTHLDTLAGLGVDAAVVGLQAGLDMKQAVDRHEPLVS